MYSVDWIELAQDRFQYFAVVFFIETSCCLMFGWFNYCLTLSMFCKNISFKNTGLSGLHLFGV
jgi:hypothetical protein